MATIKIGPESTYTGTQQVVRLLDDRLDLIVNDEKFVGLSLISGKAETAHPREG